MTVNPHHPGHLRIANEIQNEIRTLFCPNLLFGMRFEIIFPPNVLFRTESGWTNPNPCQLPTLLDMKPSRLHFFTY